MRHHSDSHLGPHLEIERLFSLLPVRGAMHKTHLQKLMLEHGGGVGLSPDLALGLYRYLVRAEVFKQINSHDQLIRLIDFIKSIQSFLSDSDPFKGKAFNYLSDETQLDQLQRELISNLEMMTSTFGMSFFEADDANPRHRKRFYRTQIPNTELAMSCCGGQGAGTFSVEILIEEGMDRPLKGLIWQIGFDLPIIDGQRLLRIISSGSGIQPGENYEERIGTLRRFEGRYGLRIENALVLLCLYIAHDLKIDKVVGLSSLGATQLSRRKERDGCFSYDRLLTETGFHPSASPHWRELTQLQDALHTIIGDNLLFCSTHAQSIVSPIVGLDLLLRAFQTLRAHDNSSLIPITVCGSTEAEGIKAHIEVIQDLTKLSAERPVKRGPTPPREIDERSVPQLARDAVNVIDQSHEHLEHSSSAIHHSINRAIQAIRRRLKALGVITPKTKTHEALCALVGDEVARLYRKYLANRRAVFKVNHAARRPHQHDSST